MPKRILGFMLFILMAAALTAPAGALAGPATPPAGGNLVARVAALEALAVQAQALVAQLQTDLAAHAASPVVHHARYTDAEAVSAVGPHTVDTNPPRTDAEILGVVDTAGYVTGDHTTNTDTQLNQAGVIALGFATGAHYS